MKRQKALKLALEGLLLAGMLGFGPCAGLSGTPAHAADHPATVKVAVLDTGVDVTHFALKGRVIASVNLTDSETESDVNGHGTHVAGIIVSNSTNVVILNVKVACDSGVTTPGTIAKGIIWATENGARIINISLTVSQANDDLKKAVSLAINRGIVVVAAAGNDGAASPAHPAACPGVISVGATDDKGNIAVWSNGGSAVSVVAPGVDVVSTIPGNSWGKKSGTSQAAALVTAKIAANLLNRA
ncbi:MAG: S8 family serine peptidase [Dehalococcoidia bacterium]|nr:S8 family serine peptidase [Dehalococcoidia bacterium]